MAKATRQAFGEALAALGETHPQVVALDADLSKSTMTCYFAEKYPDRFFEMGIAEANMIGVGAGLALSGKVPFICSFACFVVGRLDIIRMSIGYTQANVKIVGTHAGIGIGEDGASQMGLEDVAALRAIEPAVLEKSILPQIAVGRLGEPEEIARCVVFLASDEAGFITGSTISANGGQFFA